MLLRLRFSNHGSFAPNGDELHELSWVATRGSELPEHVRSLAGMSDQALPVIALYGGNASGKSNAMGAIAALRWHVLHSYPDLKDGDPMRWKPFKLDEAGLNTPTTFDLDFVVEGVRYRYGFRATADEVLAEWLHAWPKGRPQMWFEREGAEEAGWRYGSQWRFAGGSRADLFQRANRNRLLLSVTGADKHPLTEPIYKFFDALVRRPVEHTAHPFMFNKSPLMDEGRRPQIEALLRAADVGVTSYRVVNRRRRLLDMFSEGGANTEELGEYNEMFDRTGEPHQLLLLHRNWNGEGSVLEPEEESDGTIALVNFLHFALSALEHGSLFVVDELDRALHTGLACELVRLFTSPTSNPGGAQLLLSTHDTGLMDLLRRDEIVLVEKDASGRSSLAAASDFHLHKRENLREMYEAKRLGGVPRVTSMARALLARRPAQVEDSDAP